MSDHNDIPAKHAIAIECSNPSSRGGSRGEVAIGKMVADGIEHIGSLGLSAEHRGSDGLMIAIDELCKAHGLAPRDIGRVVVSVGPGGYTALRVSVTIAKVLASVAGCQVVAVPTAAVAGAALQGVDAVVALASKNSKAHCTRIVDGAMTVLGVVDGQAVAETGAGVLVGDSHLPEGMVGAAEHTGMEVRGIELTARACLEASVGIDAIKPEELGVLYAREPDAVTQWRKLHG